MASMAAAIAAARTAVSGNRPLDEKERNRFAYFSSLNSMAKKIMQDKERIRQAYGARWEKMPPSEQDEAIDRRLVDPELQRRYALHRADPPPAPSAPPGTGTTGHKLVRFGEEDITWQDEHSAPFSWETRSQMEFSVASLPAQESATGIAQTEAKQPSKPAIQSTQIKTPLSNSQVKNVQGTRTTNCEGSTPARKEEESAFWKISMERSRIEGSPSEFQSLTPSQIKSLEKGEKMLPVYYRQDSFQKEKEVSKPEKPVVITKQVKTTNPSIVSLDNPRPRSSSFGTLDVFLPEPKSPVEAKPEGKKEPDLDETSAGAHMFSQSARSSETKQVSCPSQINPSNVPLKTGFDFLDNW